MVGPFFGAGHGQVSVTTSPQPLINGLTTGRFVTVTNATPGPSIAYIHQPLGDTTNGYALEPGTSVVVDTHNSVSSWNVSTDGSTCLVSWITS